MSNSGSQGSWGALRVYHGASGEAVALLTSCTCGGDGDGVAWRRGKVVLVLACWCGEIVKMRE